MAIPIPDGPERIVYQGKIIEVVEQPMKSGEKVRVFELARRSPGVRLIIISPDQRVLLTKEYRPELKAHDFRLPGGKVIDALKDYNAFLASGGDIKVEAAQAARREAEEEVGIAPQDLELFSISRCGLTVEWDLYYFVVTSYEQKGQKLEEFEDIAVVPTTVQDARAMCLDGRISEERSALTLLRYLNTKELHA